MSSDFDEDIFNKINKLQWALGESLFRAKKLKELLDKNSIVTDPVKVGVLAIINTLTELSDLYRHNVADSIRDQFLD